MAEFRMPILGAEMESGRLVEWRVHPGDRVKRGDIVAVVDTDKAAIDVEIFEDGVIDELMVAPGARVAVGTVLARLHGAVGAAAAAVSGAPASARMHAATAPPPARAAPAAPERAPARTAAAGGPLRVSPAARRLAEERHVDLANVHGTGLAGAITREDVERAFIATAGTVSGGAPAGTGIVAVPPLAAATAAATPAAPVTDRRAALRRAVAAAMTRSKRDIPHYYLERTVVMDQAVAWRERENARRPLDERLLMIVLQLKAVALAIASVPELNGHWRDEAFHASAAVHTGVAIALKPDGLVAPALHDVEKKPLATLLREFMDLVERARAGSLRSSELSDATLTVNGLGDRGADVVHAIIYPPQVAIVGFGRVHEAAWSEHGGLVSRNVCRVSLAADHRVSDGHRGSLFLEAVDRLLQAPERL